MNDLEESRRLIDEVDAKIVGLLAERKQIVEKIIEIKRREGLEALQPDRFKQVLEQQRRRAEASGLDPDMVQQIWIILHDYFVSLEKTELDR